jgi:hypothetical protein
MRPAGLPTKAEVNMRPRYSFEAYPSDRPDRKWSRWRCTPGIASEFIEHLPSLLERVGRRPIVLYCRVSSEGQEQRGNLDDEIKVAIQQIRAMGYRLGHDLFVYDGVESSRIQCDRSLLASAIEEARKLGAIVVAPSRDRFLRSRGCGRGCPQELEPPANVAQQADGTDAEEDKGGGLRQRLCSSDNPRLRIVAAADSAWSNRGTPSWVRASGP